LLTLLVNSYLFFLFSSFALFGQRDKTDKTDKIIDFWQSVTKMEEMLYQLETDEQLDFFYESLNHIQQGIYVEISSEKLANGKYHLIISANGNKELFEDIELICSQKAVLNKFEVTAFRQANPDYAGINYEGLNLSVVEMFFEPIILDEGMGMKFYIPEQGTDITQSIINNYGAIVIDNVIGEVTFSKKIIAYDFYIIDESINRSKIYPLKSLSAFLEKNKTH